MVNLHGKEIQKRGYTYMYSWLTLLFSRNQHNIVKQLYSNKNLKKKSDWWVGSFILDRFNSEGLSKEWGLKWNLEEKESHLGKGRQRE